MSGEISLETSALSGYSTRLQSSKQFMNESTIAALKSLIDELISMGPVVAETIIKWANIALQIEMGGGREMAIEAGFPSSEFDGLCRVARQQVNPALFFASSVGASRLRKLPRSIQDRFINEPMPVVIVRTDGKGTDTLLIQYSNLTPLQAAQVIDIEGKEIVSEERQRALLADMGMRVFRRPKVAKQDVECRRGYAIICGKRFGYKMLADILSKIAPA